MPLLDSYLLDNYLIDGPNPDKPWELIASGTVTSTTGTGTPVFNFDTQVQFGTAYRVFVVYSFGKVPKSILLKRNGNTEGVFSSFIRNPYGSPLVTMKSTYCIATGDWYVRDSGFLLPVLDAFGSYTWEAYG